MLAATQGLSLRLRKLALEHLCLGYWLAVYFLGPLLTYLTD